MYSPNTAHLSASERAQERTREKGTGRFAVEKKLAGHVLRNSNLLRATESVETRKEMKVEIENNDFNTIALKDEDKMDLQISTEMKDGTAVLVEFDEPSSGDHIVHIQNFEDSADDRHTGTKTALRDFLYDYKDNKKSNIKVQIITPGIIDTNQFSDKPYKLGSISLVNEIKRVISQYEGHKSHINVSAYIPTPLGENRNNLSLKVKLARDKHLGHYRSNISLAPENND